VFNLYFSKRACKLGQFLSTEEWLEQTDLVGLNFEYVVQFTHVFLWGGCTIPQPVIPCTEGAGFLSSVVSGPMVVSRTLKTSIYGYVVLYSTDVPPDFYFVLQKRLPDLSSYHHH